MTKNLKLKIAIIEAGLTQKEVAKKAGLTEECLSMAVNGRFNLNEAEKTRVAWAIGKPPEELFTEK